MALSLAAESPQKNWGQGSHAFEPLSFVLQLLLTGALEESRQVAGPFRPSAQLSPSRPVFGRRVRPRGSKAGEAEKELPAEVEGEMEVLAPRIPGG